MDWRNQPKSFWQARLSEWQYRVTREGATERAFSGEYWNSKDPGQYKCVCCGTLLFESQTKYDSGSGWPSFYQQVTHSSGDPLEYKKDTSHGMIRTEVLCKTCGAHLGHLFDDGPEPTGQRYCINSASLKYEAE